MSLLAVTGYASLDYVIGLTGLVKGDQTTLIDYRDPAHWPRVGGCPAYVAVATAKAGQMACPVCWVGDDTHGSLFVNGLSAAGVDQRGVARLPGASPMAVLAYQADGSCACLFDPAMSGGEILSDAQREVIGAASHLCISVGPPTLMQEILACRKLDSRLYWICKNDAHCFTPSIRKSLSANADVIFCSRAERALIGDTKPSVTIVETRGTDGVMVSRNGQEERFAVTRIDARDTTGAGDTLAGAFIATQMAGDDNHGTAVSAGIQAASDLLKQRLEVKEP